MVGIGSNRRSNVWRCRLKATKLPEANFTRQLNPDKGKA
jgi:hypothetical protein